MFRPEAVKKILLVKLRAIGDSVLTLPSLEALRRGFPRAAITVLVPSHSAELFSADPRARECISYGPDLAKHLWDFGRHAAFYQGLQAKGFDLAVCLHASYRTALIGWMSGAPWRSVRNHSGRDWFCNLPAQEGKEPKSIIQRDFDALRALGLAPKETLPKLAIPASAKKAALALAKKARLPKGRSVLLFPLAGKPEKEWPAERFQALAGKLKAKGGRPAFVVPPQAPGWAGAIRVPSLLTLGALCSHAGMALGNDSGPRHIAVASGAKTLTLFGPEQLREWHPYSEKQGHLALRPASGQIRDLGLDEVAAAALKWMKR